MTRYSSVLGATCIGALGLLAAMEPASGATLFRATLTVDQEVLSNPAAPFPTSSNATGLAEFSLNDAGTALSYTITLTGLDVGSLIGSPQTLDTGDDVAKIHLHLGGVGIAGPRVFDIQDAVLTPMGPEFMTDDADDRQIDAPAGIVGGTITGIWEQSDGPGGSISTTLSAQIGNLKSNQLYANIHPNRFFANGELRGQIRPVPETTSVLSTLALGAIGACSLLRRRQPSI
ncbi:CHRD domain-containing protein [Leptolyngbya sp. FACHB-261]|uniref:CHRD domain-containing protein n=1 Tax=Leptolyngbya sp. FACHB-261 TaxID=2692806 RepID=UPI00168A22CF|nr:CHRD domain-containing protein [Leptolyngbya sp. FACHB-261]MBD2102817.1 CHRD domain-containing protein [Leptolyngbya sp. FACHB-261]